jgi:hypothetical protein
MMTVINANRLLFQLFRVGGLKSTLGVQHYIKYKFHEEL